MSRPNFINSSVVYNDHSREYNIDARGRDLSAIIRACEAEDVVPSEDISSNDTDYQSEFRTPRGRKTQRLFIDEQTAKHEKSRLLNFLHQHNLGSREFDSSEDSAVNQIAACFYRQWDKRKLLDEKAGSTAYVRFLKNECGLPVSVLEKALANVLSRMIFGDDRYPNWSGEIGAYFQK